MTEQEGNQAERGLSEAQVERASFFDGAAERSDYLSVRVGDALFLVKAEDQHVGRALYIKGGRGDIKLLARTVRAIGALQGADAVEGRTFVDVGANIGTTTVSALLFHPLGRAVALEPEPENFVTLRLNVLLNGVDERVIAIPAAASSSVGTVELVVDRTSSGLHSVVPENTLNERPRKGAPTPVPSVTLDALDRVGVLEVEEAALVWIDAEHHEGSILRGATRFTEAGVPVLLEWDPAGLAPRGEDVAIEKVAQACYTHFIDMRGIGAARTLQVQPVGSIVGYTHPARTAAGTHFTELLFLRLTKSQAAKADEALRVDRGLAGETAPELAALDAATPPTGKQLLQQLRASNRVRRRAQRARKTKQPPEPEPD